MILKSKNYEKWWFGEIKIKANDKSAKWIWENIEFGEYLYAPLFT